MDEYLELEREIKIHLSTLIDKDRESVYDYLSRRACGNDLLMDVDYRIVEGDNDQLTLKVIGDASMAIDTMPFEVVRKCWPGKSFDLLLEAIRENEPRMEGWLEEVDENWLNQQLATQQDELFLELLQHSYRPVRQLALRQLKKRGHGPQVIEGRGSR